MGGKEFSDDTGDSSSDADVDLIFDEDDDDSCFEDEWSSDKGDCEFESGRNLGLASKMLLKWRESHPKLSVVSSFTESSRRNKSLRGGLGIMSPQALLASAREKNCEKFKMAEETKLLPLYSRFQSTKWSY